VNPVTEDVKDILVADPDLGLVFATNLFVGKEPDSPDACVTIYDTGGFPPQLTLTKGEDYYRSSFQVRVRDRVYLDAWEMANDIKVLLHGKSHETWNGTSYEVLVCTGEPTMIGYDLSNRVLFTVNFTAQRH